MDDLSPLQRDRLDYRPVLPDCLAKETHLFHFACDYRVKGERAPHELLPGPVLGLDDRAADGPYRASQSRGADANAAAPHTADIERRFPLTSHAPVCRLVAVGGGTSPGSDLASKERKERARCRSRARLGLVFSGGPAPGGNNVAWGMLDCLERWAAEADRDDRDDDDDDAEPVKLVGFLGGPDGLLKRRWKHVDAREMNRRKNQGGFDLLGSGRTRLNTEAHFDAVRDSCVELELDGLVVCGGDDSNTNAAFLAEYLAADPHCRTAVVGVPKTIDDDLKGGGIGISFGFDSASGVYAEIVGNLCSDARSAGKYWHFIRVMGRNASHLTLECALRCQPNVALIGEEVAAKGITLNAVVDDIASLVEARARQGLRHGVVLVPEGLLAFTPDVAKLMDELSGVHPGSSGADTMTRLSLDARKTAASLPDDIFAELTQTRDPHGNPRLSAVDTEKLLARMVKSKVESAAVTRREESRVAAEFSRDADDGARPERWKDADALVVGVSRSGKTPLASYLAARGMKVANLPLVPRHGELMCPSQVHDVDPRRVFGLTINPEELSSIRANRLRSIGVDAKTDEEYSSLRAVRRELAMAKALYAKHPGWTTIDVTHRAIEEIAAGVVSAMKNAGVLPGAYDRDERENAVDAKFSPVFHFCGYEGRSGLPSDFDATYAYTLGYAAATLAAGGANGVIAAVTNPEASSPRDWRVAGVPLCRLMRSESRDGRERLVIKKALVDLDGGAFAAFASRRDGWRMADRYVCPGPVQFASGARWVEKLPAVLRLDAFGGMRGRCEVTGEDEREDVEVGDGRGVWAA